MPRMSRHIDSAVVRGGELALCEEDEDLELLEATSPFHVAVSLQEESTQKFSGNYTVGYEGDQPV